MRAAAGRGPDVVAVHVGADGSRRAWERLPLAGDGPLHAHDDGPAEMTKVVLADWRTGSLSIGDVRFEFA